MYNTSYLHFEYNRIYKKLGKVLFFYCFLNKLNGAMIHKAKLCFCTKYASYNERGTFIEVYTGLGFKSPLGHIAKDFFKGWFGSSMFFMSMFGLKVLNVMHVLLNYTAYRVNFLNLLITWHFESMWHKSYSSSYQAHTHFKTPYLFNWYYSIAMGLLFP